MMTMRTKQELSEDQQRALENNVEETLEWCVKVAEGHWSLGIQAYNDIIAIRYEWLRGKAGEGYSVVRLHITSKGDGVRTAHYTIKYVLLDKALKVVRFHAGDAAAFFDAEPTLAQKTDAGTIFRLTDTTSEAIVGMAIPEIQAYADFEYMFAELILGRNEKLCADILKMLARERG